MTDPVILAAASFAAIILVGSLLVAVNDWLESRPVMAKVASRRDGWRIDSALFGGGRQVGPRGAMRPGRNGTRSKQRDLLVDRF